MSIRWWFDGNESGAVLGVLVRDAVRSQKVTELRETSKLVRLVFKRVLSAHSFVAGRAIDHKKIRAVLLLELLRRGNARNTFQYRSARRAKLAFKAANTPLRPTRRTLACCLLTRQRGFAVGFSRARKIARTSLAQS